jgi:hypothetical protein
MAISNHARVVKVLDLLKAGLDTIVPRGGHDGRNERAGAKVFGRDIGGRRSVTAATAVLTWDHQGGRQTKPGSAT